MQRASQVFLGVDGMDVAHRCARNITLVAGVTDIYPRGRKVRAARNGRFVKLPLLCRIAVGPTVSIGKGPARIPLNLSP